MLVVEDPMDKRRFRDSARQCTHPTTIITFSFTITCLAFVHRESERGKSGCCRNVAFAYLFSILNLCGYTNV